MMFRKAHRFLFTIVLMMVTTFAMAQIQVVRRRTTTKPTPQLTPSNIASSTLSTETITVKGVSFKMVRVEGGSFTMGATSEQRGDAYNDEEAHRVTLNTYRIGETEVTQSLWEAVMGSNPSKFKGSQRPVEQVSWADCKQFINRLNNLTGRNFRLPTEAEWEFAARGGNKSQGYKYAGSNSLMSVAWSCGKETHNVKTKQPNELGIYDMSGNVWEWCQDWYGDYTSKAEENPSGPNDGWFYVCRGGCYFNSDRNCRVSCRNNYAASGRIIGLRLAL